MRVIKITRRKAWLVHSWRFLFSSQISEKTDVAPPQNMQPSPVKRRWVCFMGCFKGVPQRKPQARMSDSSIIGPNKRSNDGHLGRTAAHHTFSRSVLAACCFFAHSSRPARAFCSQQENNNKNAGVITTT
jgi:hypothetical protein